MSCGAEAGKWQRALATWSAELAQPRSCLSPLLFHIRDCASAGSDVRMLYFEVCPKSSRIWWMFQGTEGGLLGGSPSEFTKIPLPAVSFRGTPQQSALPRTKKVFAAFKPKPRINCAFQPHRGRFLKTRPAFMLGGLPCPARNHREEQQELWL